MSHKFMYDATFHAFLMTVDQALAEEAFSQGCLICHGPLHQANYPRSPMGIPAQLREHYDERISFCCADCRSRTTPESVRFFGRRWFPAPWLVLLNTLTLGINAKRLAQLKHHFFVTISESTLKRWRSWWRESFLQTPFWQQAQGLVIVTLKMSDKPLLRRLIDVFKGRLKDKLCSLLRWLSPLTSGFLRAI
jgi:hypothetical protein